MEPDASSRPEPPAPPLLDDPASWDRLIEAVNPASLLLAIESRMGEDVSGLASPEDVLQETLLHTWRDRAAFRWQGIGSFRRWLLAIAENRLRNLADWALAEKRGSGKAPLSLDRRAGDGSTSGGGQWAGPVSTTTPSRVAQERERSRLMREALSAVPMEDREVVRLRLIEDLPIGEVAARVGLGPEGARHRFRRGLETYSRSLESLLGVRRRELRRDRDGGPG